MLILIVILTILYPLIFFRCLSLPISVHSRRAQIVARVRHALVWKRIHFSHSIKSEFQHKSSDQMEQFLIWITMEMNRNPILQELNKLHNKELDRVKIWDGKWDGHWRKLILPNQISQERKNGYWTSTEQYRDHHTASKQG